VGGAVRALAAFDAGNGAALYAGGEFTTAGGVAANRIAMWDGLSWAALGSGLDDRVSTLAVFDDGGGKALYAGGSFTSAIDSSDSAMAKWGCSRITLDFQVEDDFTTPLVNGQDISTPAEFGALVSITSTGMNAGAAIFDSTPAGPNDPSQDRDLLVDGRPRRWVLDRGAGPPVYLPRTRGVE